MSQEDLKQLEAAILNEGTTQDGLRIALQCSSSPDFHKLFAESPSFLRSLIGLVEQPLVLQIMVNCSGVPELAEKLIELNVFTHLMEALKKKITKDMPQVKLEAKEEEKTEEGVAVKAGARGDVEWVLICMSNLTTYESGQESISKDETVLSSLLDLLAYFHGNADFDYAANVISNATCHEAGRKLVLETNPKFFLPKLKELSRCITLNR